MNYLMFGEVNSADYDVNISGEGTYNTPARDIEVIPIPGKNGTLSIDNKRFNNVDITYPAFIVSNFESNFSAFKGALMSQTGYQRLVDTYDEDHYRLARYRSEITPSMDQYNRHGQFSLIFDCDPRRFLKNGDRVVEFTSAGSLKNPTMFDALPLVRAYGTGTVTINGITVTITTADGYTDLDSEIQEAYKGATSCNSNITLTSGEFPYLGKGVNNISMTGVTKVEITPRWWVI